MRYDVWRVGTHGPVLDTSALADRAVAETYAKSEHNRNGGTYFVRAVDRRAAPCVMRGRVEEP